MKRYFILLVFLLASLVASIMLTGTLHSWQTTSFKPTYGTLVQQLRDTLIPAEPLQIRYVADAFDALRRFDEASALRTYIAYAVISHELALPAEVPSSVGEAIRWVKESPTETNTVFLKAVQQPASAGLVPYASSLLNYKRIFQLLPMGGGRVDAIFLLDDQQSKKARELVAASSCQDRGDCEQQLKKELAPYGAITEILIFVIGGALPGVILAGIIHVLGRRRKSIFLFLAVCSLLAFPVAYQSGGSGWGPLVAVLLLSYATGGFWIGLALGGWTLSSRKTSLSK